MSDDHSNSHSDVPHSHDGGVGHELSELRIAPIVWFLIGLTVATVVVCLLVMGVFDALKNREEKSERKASPLAGERRKLPPEPRLQLAPRTTEQIEEKLPPNLKDDHPLQEMKRLRAEEEGQLNSYGWVDEKAGVARIPIAEAKRLLLQKGIPTRKK